MDRGRMPLRGDASYKCLTTPTAAATDRGREEETTNKLQQKDFEANREPEEITSGHQAPVKESLPRVKDKGLLMMSYITNDGVKPRFEAEEQSPSACRGLRAPPRWYLDKNYSLQIPQVFVARIEICSVVSRGGVHQRVRHVNPVHDAVIGGL